MAYAPPRWRSRGVFARPWQLGLLPDATGQPGDSLPERDIVKLILVVGLATLSWVATFIGMLELIEANTGDLPLTHRVVIGFSAAMLMAMVVWLLDQLFSPLNPLTRLSYLCGYLFLTVISVGFGFGFFWKVIESRSESTRSAEQAVTAVQSSLTAASTRLEQLNATLVQLSALSREKAEQERVHGTSCPNSSPGDGPRRKMRDADAARFSFASQFVSGRVSAVKTDMGALDGDLARIAARDGTLIDPKSGTRNEFMRALGRKLERTVSGYNALRTDPQLRQLRQELADRADKTTFGEPGRGGFVCPDPQLAQALRGAVRAIAELPVLSAPAIAIVEGPEATIEAFRRLTTSAAGLLTLDFAPSTDELRALQKKAVQSLDRSNPASITEAGGGLSDRDYIPLAIAVFVDLCLLLVSMGRPSHRLHGLMPKMRDAEQGPVIEILSRFNDIHRDPAVRENFELFRHVVFDVHGAYYVAIPLDAPPHLPPPERDALRVEAQLLGNLFTSFEKDRIFRRTWTPFTPVVQKKLARQGSKFAASEAFRVYKFRDGAWPEIILGAVMGAARRAEADANRRRIERDLFPPLEPTLRTVEPAFRPHPRTARRPSERPANKTRPEAQADARTETNAPQPAKPRPKVMPRPVTSDAWSSPRYTYAKAGPSAAEIFGPYARSAQAELNATPETASELKDHDEKAPAAPKAVATHTVTSNEATDSGTPDGPPSARRDPHVDVVLERKTATLSFPLEATKTSDGIVGRLGEALSAIEREPAKKNSTVALAHTPAVEPFSGTEKDETRQPQDVEILEGVADDISTDPETEDAVTIAGRLRPAIRDA